MNAADIFNKKILIQTSYHPVPHLETELEIIEKLLIQKNTVYWLLCDEDFKTCFCNPDHRKLTCLVCKSRVNTGAEILLNIYGDKYLKLITYKQFKQHKTTIDSYDISTLDELKAIKYNDYYDLGMATVSSLVSIERDHQPDLIKNKEFVNNALYTGIYLYDVFSIILEDIKPDFVILFNGRFIENRPLLRICINKNISYFVHERAGRMSNYLLRLNNIPHDINAGIDEMESVWKNGEDDKFAIGERFFLKKRKGVEESWYSFIKNQKENHLPDSIKSAKRVVTIFNSSMDEYEGLEGFGTALYKNDNDAIREICNSLQYNDEISIYLRIHPNLRHMKNAQMDFINNELKDFKNLTIINAEDEVDSYALTEASDVIIVFGSTIGIEAAYNKKTVVLIGRIPYESLNCIIKPETHAQLIDILTGEIKFENFDHTEALKFGYWQEKQGIKYEYYEPINIGKGLYRGVLIKPNQILDFIEKVNNRIVKIF